MKLLTLRKNFHLDRSREIARVLLSHGWGFLRNSQGAALPTHARSSEGRAVHLRLALEELGPTFIKLGQILSTRADLLPSEYLRELAKLQDTARPVSSEEIQQAITNELGQSIEVLFREFDPRPLATASIGQAHAARLWDGSEVVVKVRKPGVLEQANEDLAILKELAATASKHLEFAEQYDLVALVEEFSQTLKAELDYIREAHNAERFAAAFAANKHIHVPRVFWSLTTSKVLTLERIRGVKINDLEGLDQQGTDRRWLAEAAANVVLKMVCEDGFFHADPHPGNFFIEPDGVIGLIDFGMVGVLDGPTQDHLAELLIAINQQNADRLVDVLIDLGVTGRRIKRESLRRAIQGLLSAYWGRPLGELKVTALLNDLYAVMRQEQLHLPPNLSLLLKTVIMIEGIGVNLDPDFQLTKLLSPYTERLIARQYSPLKLVRGLAVRE